MPSFYALFSTKALRDHTLLSVFERNTDFSVVPGFHHGVNDIFALLKFYAAYNGTFLPTFRVNPIFPSSRVKQSKNNFQLLYPWRWGPIRCPPCVPFRGPDISACALVGPSPARLHASNRTPLDWLWLNSISKFITEYHFKPIFLISTQSLIKMCWTQISELGVLLSN
jgi:hypothetical protein